MTSKNIINKIPFFRKKEPKSNTKSIFITFGFVFSYVAFIFLYPWAWTKKLNETFPPEKPDLIKLKFKNSVDKKSKLKVAVIGDSTALGQGADSVEGSFSYIYVSEVLSKKYARINYLNLGVSGARSIEVIRDQLDIMSKFKPDLVFVSVGANDVTLNTSDDEFRKNVQKITQKIEEIGAEIIWIAIPDFMVSPILLPPLNFYLSNKSKQLNVVLESVLKKERIYLVDVNKMARKVFLSQLDKYFSKDRYHPSYEGYKHWAENIVETIESKVKVNPQG